MKQVQIMIGLLIAVISLLASCNSNEDSLAGLEINLEDAQLFDFPFSEVDYVDIDIIQPQISNGEELAHGEITIVVPHTQRSLSLSLKSVDFDINKFDILPAIGATTLFSGTVANIYEISAKTDPSKSIHYDILVTIADAPEPEVLELKSFKFLASNNGSVETDTEILTTTQINSSSFQGEYTYIIFQEAVNFKELMPTVTFDGSLLEYRLNSEDYLEYPAGGTEIDFSYPNTVDFKISDEAKENSMVYRILVDVANPIALSENEINVPDIEVGVTSTLEEISTWTNQGNYPIQLMAANEYRDFSPQEIQFNNVFYITLEKPEGDIVLPGESGNISAILRSPVLEGQYEAVAVFAPSFDYGDFKVWNQLVGDANFSVVDLYDPIEFKVAFDTTE